MACCQSNCEADATTRVFWPEEAPRLMCAAHAVAAQQIGQMIGRYIPVDVLSAAELTAIDEEEALERE